jgi:hypothetical protein
MPGAAGNISIARVGDEFRSADRFARSRPVLIQPGQNNDMPMMSLEGSGRSEEWMMEARAFDLVLAAACAVQFNADGLTMEI